MVAESDIDAAEERVLLAELQRRHLLPYVEHFAPGYQTGWFHEELCATMEQFMRDVEARRSPRLLIEAPPRHGKSEIVSRGSPTWIAGRHPEWEQVVAAYGQDLADDLGRWGKRTMADPHWANLFPGSKIRTDSRAVDRIDLAAGGGLRYVGVGGSLVGRGAMVATIDDPIKNREQAMSEVFRKALMGWYRTVLRTRLAPGGGIIIMHQRWHEDDLAGQLLAEGEIGGEVFQRFSFPAIAERDEVHRRKGEALHPERYDLQSLLALEKSLGPTDFLALYQQRPTSASGTYFKVDLVNQLQGAAPKLDRVYQAWDLALTPESSGRGDYSVGATMGIDHVGRYWLLDLVRGRWSPDECARQMIAFWRKHQAARVWMEGGPPFLGVQPSLVHAMRRSGVWIPYEAISHGGKAKDVRAIAIRGVINGGNLYVPSDAEWWPHVRSELAAFPSGRTDDCVDPLAYLGLKSGEMLPNKDGRPPPKLPVAAEKSAMVKKQLAEIQERRKQQARDPLGWQ